MVMQIIRANLMDLNALRLLEKACFPLDAWPLLDLVGVLSMPGVIRLKMVEGGEMVGFAAVDPHTAEGVSWIATICIHPQHQNKGWGRALLLECERQIQTPLIKLCVRPANDPATHLYRSMGYQAVDTWRAYYNDGGDALVMQKALDHFFRL